MNVLLIFGVGYSASAIGRRLRERGWRIIGSVREAGKASGLAAEGWEPLVFDGVRVTPEIRAALDEATHVLGSIPPDEAGDPVLRRLSPELARAPRLRWIGYLSTVGVYGDHGGNWVDEDTPPAPASWRSRLRLQAEQGWTDLALGAGKRLDIFRLAGIYGPGRSALDRLASGLERRVTRPGQVFNRIHVDDLATVVSAAAAQAGADGQTGAPSSPAGAVTLYNVADDEPASAEDVVCYAARLLGLAPPPPVPVDSAGLSPLARSFYLENKRVLNAKLKERLGVDLRYPTYREGLAAIRAAAKLSPAVLTSDRLFDPCTAR